MNRRVEWGSDCDNLVLAASAGSRTRKLAAGLNFESCRTGTVLFEADAPLECVYFPLSGIVSLVVPGESGKQQEVCMVGREGAVGFGFGLGITRMPLQAVCQSPVTLLSMRHADLKQALRLPRFSAVVVRYTEFRLFELIRATTCKHLVEQRLAKWVLTAGDRLGADTFPLTHAATARLLDVRRPGITEAAQKLQAAGAIEYASSEITILDRDGLEQLACHCYGYIRAELEGFMRFATNR